jgi:acyl dehydratase
LGSFQTSAARQTNGSNKEKNEMATRTAADPVQALEDYLKGWNARIGERRKIGVHRETHRDYCISVRHITDDLIRIFAISTGDANPLWRQHDYASKSVWGGIIAPPMAITCVSSTTALPPAPNYPGWSMMAAGGYYEMERPLRPGDVLDAEDVWGGFEERSKPGRPHRTFLIHGERHFTDQTGKSVGKLSMRAFALAPVPGADTASKPSGPQRERRRYSDQELKEIYDHYDAENGGKLRRGAEPRFWEDVNVGDEIGRCIKGPVDVMDCASFVGAIGGGVGFADKWKLIKAEIDLSPKDPITGAHHFNMDWHLDDATARSMGQPFALNFGVLMEVNFTHAVTNWAGDHGFLRVMDNKVIAPMYLGETLYITGAVTRKYEENGRGLIEIQLSGSQQDGINVAAQRAVVQLPHKGRPDEVVKDVFS